MIVNQINHTDYSTSYRITIPFSIIHEKIDSIIESYLSSVKLPGFRKGKVPISFIKLNYLNEIKEKALKELMSDANKEFLKDRDNENILNITTKIELFSLDQDLVYILQLDFIPEILLSDFNKTKLKKIIVNPSEKDIDKEIRIAFKSYLKALEEDHYVKIGDIVDYTISIRINSKEIRLSNPKFRVTAGSNESIFEEIDSNLIGKKNKSHFILDIKIQKKFKELFSIGKRAKVEIFIENIFNKIELLEINNQLAKNLGYDNIEDLRSQIAKKLEIKYNTYSYLMIKRNILDNLSNQYKFTVPEEMVESEFEIIWKKLQLELKSIKSNSNYVNEINNNELKEQYKKIAYRRVQLGIIISKIIKKFNISMNEEEVKQIIYQDAKDRSKGPQDPMFQKTIEHYYKNEDSLKKLLLPVLENKVVDFIIENSLLEEENIDFQSLKERSIGILPPYIFEGY